MSRQTITMRFQVHSDELPYLYAMLASLPDGKLSRRNALLMRLEGLLSGHLPHTSAIHGVMDAAPVPAQAPPSASLHVPPPLAQSELSRPKPEPVELDQEDLDEIFGR